MHEYHVDDAECDIAELDSVTPIEAYDAEEAAETFAEEHHSDWDYMDTMTLRVRECGKTEATIWRVSAEQTVCFTARQVEPENNP